MIEQLETGHEFPTAVEPSLATMSDRIACTSMRFPRLMFTAVSLCVGFLQFLLLYPLHTTLDLPRWDEAIYIGRGDQFIHGGTLGALSGSPFYALLYSVLIRVSGTVNSVFYMQYAVKICVAVLLFVFLSLYLKSQLVAVLLTMIWLVSDLNLREVVLVYHAALGVFLIGLLCLRKHQIIGLPILCLAVLTRLEYLFPAIMLAGYIIWKRRNSGGRLQAQASHLAVASVLGALVIYVLFHVSDFNVGGKRTWFAFNQNYARRQVDDGRYHINPYIDSNIVIQADFPGANSLREALFINPRFFAKHVARNMAAVPKVTLAFLTPYSPGTPALIFGVWAGFAVTIFALASLDNLFVRRVLSALRSRRMMLYATLAGTTALLPMLFVYPMAHYTLILAPFVLFWLGFVWLEALQSIHVPGFSRRVLVALAVLFAAGIVVSRKPYASKEDGRPVLAQVRQLLQIWPNQRLKLLGVGSSWYAGYIGTQNVLPIEPLATAYGEKIQTGSDNLYKLLDRYNPDVVLINGELTTSRNFDLHSLAALNSRQWAECSTGDDRFYFRTTQASSLSKCLSHEPRRRSFVAQ